MGHGKGIEQRAQRITDKAFLDAVVGRCSGLSYSYRDVLASDGDVALPGPNAGDRSTAIDFDSDAGMLDPESPSCYLLAGIADGGNAREQAATVVARISGRFPGVVDTRVCESDEVFRRRCGPGTQLVLVRPDGYIGARCGIDSAEALSRKLAAELGLSALG